GVMGTLTAGEREAGDLHRPPLRMDALRKARAFSVESFLISASRFGRRFVLLGAWLYLGYAILATFAVSALILATRLADRDGWSIILPLSAVVVTAVGLVGVGAL